MKISHRLLLLAGVSLLGIIVIVTVALYSLRSGLTNSRHVEIVRLLEKAENVVEQYRGLEGAGKLSRDDAQAAAKRAIAQLNVNKDNYYFVLRTDATMLVHPVAGLIGKVMVGKGAVPGQTDTQAYREALGRTHFGLVDVLIQRTPDGPLVKKLQGVVAIPAWDWIVGTGFFYDDINAVFWDTATALLAISLVGALLVCGLSWITLRSVRRILGGEPAEAAEAARQIAAGNLAVSIHADTRYQSSLIYALHEMQTNLRALVAQIQQASESISTGSSEIAQGNLDLSQRTEEQAASLEETAASMEQLSGAIQSNSENSRQGSQMALQAQQASERGGEVIEGLIGTIGSVAEHSRKIGQITGLIEGIAFQTNILALNAAVEAARAGDQGRGFAVVASEVRSLAQRSAAAAKDIKQLIDTSTRQANEGAEQVGVAGTTMKELVASIAKVSGVVREISEASTEQGHGIAQVTKATTQMDQVTQQNAALVEQLASASSLLNDQSSQLRESVARFRL